MKIALTDDFAACMAIRRQVFVQEQNVPEQQELDEHDATALHLLATLDGRPVGTARLLIDGTEGRSAAWRSCPTAAAPARVPQ